MNLRSITFGALAAFVLVLWGCGSDDSAAPAVVSSVRTVASPSATTGRFLEAVQADDTGVFRALLTKQARAALGTEEGLAFDGDQIDSFEVLAEKVIGEEAEVTVSIRRGDQDQEATLLLRQEAGLWRVYGMRVAFGDGSFTLDFEAVSDVFDEIAQDIGEELGAHFEEAFAEMETSFQQGGTLEQIAAERAAFERLEALTRQEFEASWRIDLVSNGRSAADLIGELLEPTGIKLAATGHSEVLATAISLDLSSVSRIEAIEAIATAAGLHPVWPELSSAGFDSDNTESAELTFEVGSRALPSTFAGPFLIELTELSEGAPQPVGSMTLTIRALGLHPSALAYQTEMAEILRVAKARSAGDQPLTDEAVQHWGTPEIRGGYYSYSLRKELTGLLRSVETIELIQGEVYLALPERIETLELVRASDEYELSAGTLKVTEWTENVRFRLDGTEENLQGLVVRMSPRKDSGDPLGTLYGSTNGWGSSLQGDLQCPEEPAAVDLKFCGEEVLTFAFELNGVPLAHFAKQPERLEPLAFDGLAPLQAEAVGGLHDDGGQTKLTLRLNNRSNKDATSVMVKFFYLDEQGEVLGDFPHNLSGDYDFDLQKAGTLVVAGQTVERESFAAFVPEGTARVRFELQQVSFPDGTNWSSKP